MSKSKRNGTRYERQVRQRLQAADLATTRLAEEGNNDAGDLLITSIDLVVECRWRQAMGIHQALGKAISKAQAQGHRGAMLAWKRTIPTGGAARQAVPGGVREVWGFDRETATELLRVYQLAQQEGLV